MLEFLSVGGELLHDTSTRSLAQVDGLIGIPGARGEGFFDRPEDDGGVEPNNFYMPARTITLEGELWGASIDDVWTDFGVLAEMFEEGLHTDLQLVFQHHASSVVKMGNVRLAGPIDPVVEGGAALLKYQVQLRAADPRWYATVEQSAAADAPQSSGGFPIPIPFPIPFGVGGIGGTVTATNSGNTRTWPRITIQGPIVGPVITNSTTARSLVFENLTLGEGDTLTVDCGPTTRAATVNGVNVTGTLRWEDSYFFSLVPGDNLISFYGLGGGYSTSTALVVYYRDAYTF